MKKTRKFDEGGFTYDEEVDPAEVARKRIAEKDAEYASKFGAPEAAEEMELAPPAPKAAARKVAKPAANAANAAKSVVKVEAPKRSAAESFRQSSRSPEMLKSGYGDRVAAPATPRAPAKPSPFAGMRDATSWKNVSRGMKSGGTVSSASKRADGIAQRGKTKGRMV